MFIKSVLLHKRKIIKRERKHKTRTAVCDFLVRQFTTLKVEHSSNYSPVQLKTMHAIVVGLNTDFYCRLVSLPFPRIKGDFWLYNAIAHMTLKEKSGKCIVSSIISTSVSQTITDRNTALR